MDMIPTRSGVIVLRCRMHAALVGCHDNLLWNVSSSWEPHLSALSKTIPTLFHWNSDQECGQNPDMETALESEVEHEIKYNPNQ